MPETSYGKGIVRTTANKNGDALTEKALQKIAQAQQREYRILEQMRVAEEAKVQKQYGRPRWIDLFGTWSKLVGIQIRPLRSKRIKHVDVEIVEPKQLPPPKD